MSIKPLLCPARVRRIPAQFSWIDQRLVREGLIRECSADGLALYLFLVTVADAQGLSYYSDAALLHRLACLDPPRLARARAKLQRVDWIAYRPPVYQVLALAEYPRAADRLQPAPSPSPRPRTAQPIEILQRLRHGLEGGHD
jgi:hypothetical protein